MARIRSIKPELLEDEKTAALTDTEWRLFVSLILMADDYGNLRAAPAKLAGTAFWGAPQPIDIIARAHAKLVEVGLVAEYRVAGQTYAHLCGWDKHQRVDKPGKRQCPPPPAGLSRESREDSAKVSETPVPDQEDEKEKEDERETRAGAEASPVRADQKRGTVYWLRRIYRPLWEELYSGAFFASSRGDETAWQNHLAANPEDSYQEMLFAEAPRLLRAYLADRDPKLLDRRHPLAFFPERMAKYRAQAPPRGRSAFSRDDVFDPKTAM